MEIPLDKQGAHPLVVDGDIIWTTGGSVFSPSLYRINATNGQVTDEFPFSGNITLGDGDLWVSDWKNEKIIRINTQTSEVAAEIPLTIKPSFLVFGEGALWALEYKEGLLLKVDPKLNQVVAEIQIGEAYSSLSMLSYAGMAVGGGAVWISDYERNTVLCIDTSNNTVVARIPTFGTHPIGSYRRASKDPLPVITKSPNMFSGRMPGTITFGNGFVWVATRGSNKIDGGHFILKIDPEKRLPVEEIWLPNKSRPVALGLSRHAIWALHFPDAEMTKIGLTP
jgi:YVTN family beta-propeller protein